MDNSVRACLVNLPTACLPMACRACRATLIVVGHAESLQGNLRWSALVSHVRKSRCMYKAGEATSVSQANVCSRKGGASPLAGRMLNPAADTAPG